MIKSVSLLSVPLLLQITSHARGTPRTPYNFKYQHSPSPLSGHTRGKSPGLTGLHTQSGSTQKKAYQQH